MSLLLMVPLLLWLSVWAFSKDEPLRPEIEALLRLERLADDPDNAYFLLMGLQAPEGADAHRVGSLAVFMAFGQLEKGVALDQLNPTLPMGEALSWTPLESMCEPGVAVCLPQMRAQAPAIKRWMHQHAAIMARYLEATLLPLYVDMDVGAAAMAQRLEELSNGARFIAVERWTQRQPREALQWVERSLNLCQRVLGGTVTLVTKQAARRCMTHGWELASAFALDASRTVLKRHAADFQRLTPLLLPTDTPFVEVLRSRLRQQLPHLLDLPQAQALTQPQDPWLQALLRPFFLPHATLNRYYENVMAQASLDQAPAAALLRYAAPQIEPSWWARLRSGNPIGAWLLEQTPSATLLPDMLEVRALESQRRLFLLTLQCVQAGTLPKDPEACVAAAPPALRNPFDGSAPQWDESARSLKLPIPQPTSASYPAPTYLPQVLLPTL